VLRRQGGRQEGVVAADGRRLLPCQRLHPCKSAWFLFSFSAERSRPIMLMCGSDQVSPLVLAEYFFGWTLF
jgi:hypothetical protein